MAITWLDIARRINGGQIVATTLSEVQSLVRGLRWSKDRESRDAIRRVAHSKIKSLKGGSLSQIETSVSVKLANDLTSAIDPTCESFDAPPQVSAGSYVWLSAKQSPAQRSEAEQKVVAPLRPPKRFGDCPY